MKVSAKTPTVDFIINDVTFVCPAPFDEGHTCSAGEAGTLNQTLRENVRNRFSKAFKALAEGGKALNVPELQAQLNEYIVGYDFGGTTRGSVDPVMRRALTIAKLKVVESLKAQGKNIKDYTSKEIGQAASDAVAKNPKFLAVAKKQLAEDKELTI